MKKAIVLIACTAVVLTLAACGRKAKDDFAGFSFDATRADLEAAGFTCKKEEKTEYTCVNINWKGSVLGRDTRKVTFTRHAQDGSATIAVDLVEVPDGLVAIVALQHEIDQMYDRDKSKDIRESFVWSATWNRPDGSVVRFNYFPGMSRLIPSTASFAAAGKPKQ